MKKYRYTTLFRDLNTATLFRTYSSTGTMMIAHILDYFLDQFVGFEFLKAPTFRKKQNSVM